MKVYALDTDIISAILKNNEAIINRYGQEVTQGREFIIPPIVFYEIQRGLLASNMLNRLKSFNLFCQDITVGEFCYDVWLKAAQIYATLSQQGKPIGHKFDGDVFIAAYCVINDYTLITINTEHFARVEGLNFVDWRN